jgi:DNA invertase Pin-like site-specific DNA recombinase
MDAKLIAYFRVSTAKQGQSGLGLEAQEATVKAYAKATGGSIVRTFSEIETGKSSERPELLKALAHAKRTGSKLVIAKLDRLSRNVYFTSYMMESGVDFIACDMPNANRLTVHIMAAVAEQEAKAISERTKAALAAYKARGGILGAALTGSALTPEARAKGTSASTTRAAAKAREAFADLLPEIKAMKAKGLALRAIADELNKAGHTTAKGSAWSQVQVKRVLDRETVGA